MTRVLKWLSILFIFAVFGLLAMAYNGATNPGGNLVATPPSGPTMDPILKEFYNTLGGEPVLGKPLTGLFEQGGHQCQYTDAVLICYDPNEPDISLRFHLEPLGIKMGVRELDPISGPIMGSRDLGNGYKLYPEFETLYDQVFGAHYAGRPLTQVRINAELKRYEQFFENMGFYRDLAEAPGTAHLIPYGDYQCGPECSKRLNEYWAIIQSGLMDQPFSLSLSRLSWTDLGNPLTDPRVNSSGTVQQVYENVILSAPRGDLSQVTFLPLASMLHVADDVPLVARIQHDQLVFYEVADGLGHNVPFFFDKFIAIHGGRDLAGKPLTELYTVTSNRLYRQCFESYCLDYDTIAPENLRVRMYPLGLEYMRSTDPTQVLRKAFTPETVLLQVEAEQDQLGIDREQRIMIHAFRRSDMMPMYLVEGTVTINTPDQPSVVYHFKPTDASGTSTLVLPPFKDLPRMTVVEYVTCLNLPGEPKICAPRSFIYRGD